MESSLQFKDLACTLKVFFNKNEMRGILECYANLVWDLTFYLLGFEPFLKFYGDLLSKLS